MTEAKLDMILHRDVDGKLKLWACRGAGKGCKRNETRRNKAPCDDCLPAHDENETLGDLVKRLERGDA